VCKVAITTTVTDLRHATLLTLSLARCTRKGFVHVDKNRETTKRDLTFKPPHSTTLNIPAVNSIRSAAAGAQSVSDNSAEFDREGNDRGINGCI